MTPRVKIKYTKKVVVPLRYKRFLWDTEGKKVIVQKLVYRVLKYGGFEDIKWVWKKYPEVAIYVIKHYKDIHRGVIFWIKRWQSEKAD